MNFMKRPGFRIIDDGAFADFEFEACGATLEELFVNCARALFSALTELDSIRPEVSVEFSVVGDSSEDLLFAFLSELVFIKDTKKMFFNDFEVNFLPQGKLHCRCHGEPIDRRRHVIKTDVKAATYHKMKIVKNGELFTTRVILDL